MQQLNLLNTDFFQYLKEKHLRYCRWCLRFKPDRTHHCRQCGCCVAKMDHHCNWVLNCVGHSNYKFFLQMIFYSLALLLYVQMCFFDVVVMNFID